MEKAKKENIIVYLGTGSGKTFIATMLIKEMRNQLMDKKAIFLVNSVALVDQQAEAIRICTGLSVSNLQLSSLLLGQNIFKMYGWIRMKIIVFIHLEVYLTISL